MMKSASPGHRWIIGCAALLGAMSALMVLPRARSTVAAQGILALGRQPEWLRAIWSSPRRELEPRLARVVARAPDNPELQTGAAMFPMMLANGESQTHGAERPRTQVIPSIIRRLGALALRFPDDAPLRAHQLRYLSMREVWIPRPDGASLAGRPAGQPFPYAWDSSRPAPSAAVLKAFDVAASEGTRLEPENGFFFTMRAAGAFAAGRERAALRHLHEAARQQSWNDHAADEPRAQSKLLEAAYGERGSLQKAYLTFGLLFSHFSLIQAAAWMAIWQALQYEQAGDATRSMQIRHDVMQLGMKIADSSRLDGHKRIGVSIFQIGGSVIASPPPRLPLTAGDLRAYQYPTEAYQALLLARGQRDEAEWVRAEGERARAMEDQIPQTSPSGQATLLSQRLVSWWLYDILVARMVLSLLGLWAAAALLSWMRRRTGDARGGPSPGAWIVLCLLLFIAPMARLLRPHSIDLVWDSVDLGPVFRLVASLALVWSAGPLLARLRGRGGVPSEWRGVLNWLRAILTIVLAPVTVIAALGPQTPMLGGLTVGVTLSGLLWLSRRAGQGEQRSGARPQWKPGVVAFISILPSVLVPVPIHDRMSLQLDLLPEVMRGSAAYADLESILLLLVLLPIGLLIFLQLCRVAALGQPLLAGLARGLRQTAPCAIALLLAVYIGAMIPTIAADRALDDHLDQLLTPPSQAAQLAR